MLVRVYYDRMFGSDYLDWLKKALFSQLSCNNTNLCIEQYVPVLYLLNEETLNLMDPQLKKQHGTIIEQLATSRPMVRCKCSSLQRIARTNR